MKVFSIETINCKNFQKSNFFTEKLICTNMTQNSTASKETTSLNGHAVPVSGLLLLVTYFTVIFRTQT